MKAAQFVQTIQVCHRLLIGWPEADVYRIGFVAAAELRILARLILNTCNKDFERLPDLRFQT